MLAWYIMSFEQLVSTLLGDRWLDFFFPFQVVIDVVEVMAMGPQGCWSKKCCKRTKDSNGHCNLPITRTNLTDGAAFRCFTIASMYPLYLTMPPSALESSPFEALALQSLSGRLYTTNGMRTSSFRV